MSNKPSIAPVEEARSTLSPHYRAIVERARRQPGRDEVAACLAGILGQSELANPVLIYACTFGGHRHLYAYHLAALFSELGVPVVVASLGYPDGRVAGTQAIRFTWKDVPPTVTALGALPHAAVADIEPAFSVCGDHLLVVHHLQQLIAPRLTVFVDGDNMADALMRQGMMGLPRLAFPTAGLFINWELLYTPEGLFPDDGHPAFGGFAVPVKRPGMTIEEDAYLSRLPGGELVDWVLSSDENAVSLLGGPHMIHMAELGAPEGALPEPPPDPHRSSYFERRRAMVMEFLDRHRDGDLLLLFGDLEARKGFEDLVAIAMRRPDTAVLRVGRTKPFFSPSWELVNARETLLRQDRYLEIEGFLDDHELQRTLFERIRLLVLPYRKFLRSSGVMVDALRAGRPVIVPDGGLMAERVKRHRLGLTFKPGDFDSLLAAFDALRQQPEAFHDPIATYVRDTLSSAALKAQLADLLDRAAGVGRR